MKKFSKKNILKTPWLTLRKDGYKNAKGIVNYYYIIERSDFVVIVPRTKDNKFILVRQYRYGIEDFVWNFPMGYINKKEKPKIAAKRELFEETGLSAKKLALVHNFSLAPSFVKSTGYVFYAKDISTQKMEIVDRKENIEKIGFFTKEQIENLIEQNKLIDLSTIAAYFLMKNCFKQIEAV